MRKKTTYFFNPIICGVFLIAVCVFTPGISHPAVSSIEKLSREALSYVISEDLDGFHEKALALRNELYRKGIVSFNDFADRVYELTEDKNPRLRSSFLREALIVAPLNVKFWVYLSLSDIITFEIFRFPSDFVNLIWGSLKNPIALIKTIFIVIAISLMLIVAFSFFFGMGIFFKYSQNIIADLTGGKAFEKVRVVVFPLLVGGILFAFFSIRSPLLLLFLLIVILSPYMVHREFVVTIILGVALLLLSMGYDNVKGLSRVALTGEGSEAIQLAYGIGGEEVSVSKGKNLEFFDELVELRTSLREEKYSRARDIARRLAEKRDESFFIYESIARFYGGDKKGALALVARLYRTHPDDPVVAFNLYQLYLANFQFEKAQEIQSSAIEMLRKFRPFEISPEDVKEGVLIPPTPSLKIVFTEVGREEIGQKELPFSVFWRIPHLSVKRTLLSLLLLLVCLRVITFNRYLHIACKVCGERQPWRVRLKKDDICGSCASKSHMVRGSALTPEKVMGIRLYRKSTIYRSLFIPGYPLLAVNAVTLFVAGVFLVSLFLSFIVIFHTAFPKTYSSLYDKIYYLGSIVTFGGFILSYLFFNGLGYIYFRRILKKHKVWEI